jgi:SAM-dependent methyltransferase
MGLRSLIRRAGGRDYRAAVGGHWDEIGQLQLDFLVKHGLEPGHRLLDMPCGSFRVGRLLIPYLEPGHYIGLDADHELLEAGKREVLGSDLLGRAPRIGVARMPAPLPTADVAWCHALFDHIPPEATRETIVELVRAAPRVYATFFLTDTPDQPQRRLRGGSEDGAITTYPDREYWHHSHDFVHDAARAAGARVVTFHGGDAYPHPLGLTIAELARV